MDSSNKARRIALFCLSTPQMRAFHMTWVAFFLCFFAWFGIAPLMPVVRAEMGLSKEQVGWCIIGSVAIDQYVVREFVFTRTTWPFFLSLIATPAAIWYLVKVYWK
jgi:hypothetical protein